MHAPDSQMTHLPAPPTPLVGREREAAAIRQRLQQPATRMLTLTGPGGIGKTRLALQVATDLADAFAGGTVFVPLASINDPGLVVPAIAQALDIRELGGRPIFDILKEYLRPRALLLVLDNFEHVATAAPLVAELLAACHQVKVLATSRARLHLRADH